MNAVRLAEILFMGAIEVTGAPDDEKRLIDEIIAALRAVYDGRSGAKSLTNDERTFLTSLIDHIEV